MTDDAKFTNAAKAIAGADPPTWLEEIVRLGVDVIRGNHTTRANFPSRKAIRDRLDSVRAAAETLALEFNSNFGRDETRYAAIAFLIDAGLDQSTLIALVDALPKLAACAASVAPIREGKGPDKAFPNTGALSPHELCAGLVSFGWLNTRGTLPPHTSNEAHNACEAVWAATELPRAHFGGSLTGWRGHLISIRQKLDSASSADNLNRSFQTFWDGLANIADLSTCPQKRTI